LFRISRKLYGEIGPAFYGLRTTLLTDGLVWVPSAGRLFGELGGRRYSDSASGKLHAVDDLQHRKAAMALSEKAPKLVALSA
jgi:hypothetical protein